MAWQKFPVYLLWSTIICSLCTNKLYAAATVHFLCQKQLVQVCHFKALSCTNYNCTLNVNVHAIALAHYDCHSCNDQVLDQHLMIYTCHAFINYWSILNSHPLII